MKKITCDFCGKDITMDELHEEYGWYDDCYYDLCSDCDEIYDKINHEMAVYRNKKRRELEKNIEKKVKEKLEEIRKGKK